MRSAIGAAALLFALICHGQRPALIGYYAGDGAGLDHYQVEQLTHIIWCFAQLEGDSMAVLAADEVHAGVQQRTIDTMVGFKKRSPGLKVLLSLGGWGGCAACSEVFGRAEGRRHFALSVLHAMHRFHVDGIDLDWEYPAVQGHPGHRYAFEDRHNFTLLLHELRKTLGPDYEISFAAGGTDECLLRGFEWDSILPLVDRVNVMSYDLVHGYSSYTGHHTPLFPNEHQRTSAHGAVLLLDQLGVPLDKVVIGAAFYGRVFQVNGPDDDGIYAPARFDHTIPFSAVDTLVTEANGWEWSFDAVAEASFAYDAGDQLFFTGDDSASVAAKARYVRERGLGGIMFWQLRDDRPVNGLLKVMFQGLRDP